MNSTTAIEHVDEQFDKQARLDADVLYHKGRLAYSRRIDKLFIALFCVQWPVAIALAFFMTPATWAGTESSTHLHVYMAVGLGALATLFPAWLAWKRPGAEITRHVIAASAMIFTALFIHLSGGRDEGHFHFFMMMAFVALYFDWKVVITAIVVGALDHVLRTAMFPMSVFGVLESPWFQLFRHVLWVVFEGAVLLYAAVSIDKDKRQSAMQLAVSQLREQQINELVEENRLVSAERAQRQREASEAAEARRAAETSQRQQAEAVALREAKDAELLKAQVQALLASVNDAASGNLDARITVKGDDAIGQLGGALELFLSSLSGNLDRIKHGAIELSDAAKSLDDASKELGVDSKQSFEQLREAAENAELINRGVQDTAVSTEQMNEAIREVSRCASEAVNVGQEAVLLASKATSTVNQLGLSSSDIGNVLKVITSIAEQTNLLALNATIEAARAGDAGKGFAVVANEVKELAKETANATGEISARIAAIQADANDAGEVIAQISTIIEQIENYQTTVAAAVEEQSATTREISKSVKHSASGNKSISQTIERVSDNSAKANATADRVYTCSKGLSEISRHLNDMLAVYSHK